MYSIVILTLNEEANLPKCLASIAACDDIVVLDSGSTDRTAAIARDAGARVFTNPFRDFAQQRNHAHTDIPFRHAWVLHLDADECLTPQLHAECAAFAASAAAETSDGCYIAPKMIFRGRWIPHCTDFPAYQARFVHVQRFRFVQAGHGQREAPGLRMAHLRHSYLHDLSAQPESEMIAKHARYARAEAAAFMRNRRPVTTLLGELAGRETLRRRRALKELSQHLPFRGPLRLIYQYCLRGGFLDGRAGWAYCRILARYEADVQREIRRLRATTP
ncbi:MAG: glycosyltransferase family 2 protein [Opitutaceae bacterium]|nr:glycosyltransferase family 2 protein [Opitutaceae bacterium]